MQQKKRIAFLELIFSIEVLLKYFLVFNQAQIAMFYHFVII